MDWRIEGKPSAGAEDAGDRDERARVLTRALEAPNAGDSFRTLIEAMVEDLLVGGGAAAEMELTGEAAWPVRLWPVDGATVPGECAVGWRRGDSAVCAGDGGSRGKTGLGRF